MSEHSYLENIEMQATFSGCPRLKNVFLHVEHVKGKLTAQPKKEIKLTRLKPADYYLLLFSSFSYKNVINVKKL